MNNGNFTIFRIKIKFFFSDCSIFLSLIYSAKEIKKCRLTLVSLIPVPSPNPTHEFQNLNMRSDEWIL